MFSITRAADRAAIFAIKMATANNTLEDELSNPSVEEEEDEEEEESEDEEPIFNYKRFSEDLVKGLGPPKDANLQNFRGIAVELISCIAVHMRVCCE